MINDIKNTQEERMKKSIEALKREFGSLRAGRATPALLDKVMVDYYGTPTPINQVAKVSVPEPRMITIQPWEKPMLHEIEKAIMKNCLLKRRSSKVRFKERQVSFLMRHL